MKATVGVACMGIAVAMVLLFQTRASAEPNLDVRRIWLDGKGYLPSDNDVAVAALCWAAVSDSELGHAHAMPHSKKVESRFARRAALDLRGVLPHAIDEAELRRVWLDLYGTSLTERAKGRAAIAWVEFIDGLAR